METRRWPELVVAADWSVNAKKRWMVRAELGHDRNYRVSAPEPVGEPKTLLSRMQVQAGADASVLMGFDFPIGLPIEYVRRSELSDFRTALMQFGHGNWSRFYDISDSPDLRQPFFPRSTRKGVNGNYLKHLLGALRVEHKSDLLRICDRRTNGRQAAECLFFTCGARQVGAGAIVGWRDVITPSLGEIKLWPFDGPLFSLLSERGVTVGEIYPAEAYSHLKIPMGQGTRYSKRIRAHRQEASSELLEVFQSDAIRFSHSAQSWIEWGFLDEDDFDAMVGLLSMLLAVTGKRLCQEPTDDKIRKVEGWILGQDCESGSV